MKIVFLAQLAGSPQHGMVYGHYYLAREWVRQGHEVTIIAGVPFHSRFKEPDCPNIVNEEVVDGIRYLWLRCVPYQQHQWLKRILNIFSFVALTWLKRLPIEDADVVICSSHQPLAILGAERLSKRLNAGLVFEVRDLWPLSLIEMSGTSRKNPFIMLLQWAEDRAYRKAQAVVSVLPHASKYMVSRGMSPEKFNYIPNGVDLDSVTEEKPLPALHQKVLDAISPNDFCIGYAGNMGYANALDIVLHALVNLPPNVKFFLVGNGSSRDQLLEEVSILGLAERVFILPSVNKGQVATFLNRMDALYIGLRHKEIFRFGVSPTKMNDYLLAAKPIIYAINVPHEAIDEGGAGIGCDSREPDTITQAINSLLEIGEESRLSMGASGNAWVRENRDYKVLAEKFMSVIITAGNSA